MLIDVKVKHTGLNTNYQMTIRSERMDAFETFIKYRHCLPYQESWGGEEWVSGGAVIGLNAIFTHIPNKFPLQDLIRWVAKQVEVEDLSSVDSALVIFGQRYPGITGSGEDVT